MSKTIEERANEYATKRVGGHYQGGFKGDMWGAICAQYIEIATEQKTIDDEEYRKDMRYVGVKQEELIDRVVDVAMEFFNEQFYEEEGCYFFNPHPRYGQEDRANLKAEIQARIEQRLSDLRTPPLG